MNAARKRLTLAAGGLLALLFVLPPIAGVFAYVGQNPYVVQMRGPSGPVRCDATAKVTATVTDVGSGNLVPGQAVKWDFKNSPSAGDKVTPKTSVTDNNAETTVTVSFGPVEGQRVVRAMIASWPTTIKVSCQGGIAPPNPTPTPTRRPTPTPTKTPTRTPTRTPTQTPTQTPTAPRPPTPTETQTSEPSPVSTPATSPSPAEASPTPSTAPLTPGTSAPPPSTTPIASPADSPTPDAATPSPEPVVTEVPAVPAVPAVPVPTMTPFTPQVVAQGPALGLATFGLIGLVGLVTGTVTFLLLRKR